MGANVNQDGLQVGVNLFFGHVQLWRGGKLLSILCAVEHAHLQRHAETYRGYLGPDIAVALHHVLVTGLKQLQHLGDVDADGA